MLLSILTLCISLVPFVLSHSGGKIVSKSELIEYLTDEKGREFSTCGVHKTDTLYIPKVSAKFANVEGKNRVRFALKLGGRAKTPGRVLKTPWLVYTPGANTPKQGMIIGAAPEGVEAFEKFKAAAAEETNTDGNFRAFLTKFSDTDYGAIVAIGGDTSIWTGRVYFGKTNFFEKQRCKP